MHDPTPVGHLVGAPVLNGVRNCKISCHCQQLILFVAIPCVTRAGVLTRDRDSKCREKKASAFNSNLTRQI